MPYIELESLDDARLDVFARLTEAQLRNKLEPEKGIFIVESEKVIDRALLGGVQSLSMLMTPEWVDRTREIVSRAEAACEEPGGMPVFVVPSKEAERLTGFAVTRGILLACRRPQLSSVEDLLARVDAEKAARAAAVAAGELDPGEVGNMHDASRRRIAVLEGIVDHTNVGAIFRSAAAMGIDAVLVTPTCCDPLYRRAVRVSMGCVFQVPWTRIGSEARVWPHDGLSALHDAGFSCAAMALTDDSVSLDDPVLRKIDRLAIFMGTEGAGLGAKTIAGCDHAVRIPMAHGVDSLNVAAASAVAFWQLCPHVSNEYHYQPGLYH